MSKIKPIGIEIETLKTIVSYDPATGVFRWGLSPPRFRSIGAIAGHVARDGYLQLGIGGRMYLAHRVAWMVFYGKEPGNMLDHINGNRLDNRISNLRISSARKNNLNTSVHRNGKLPGVNEVPGCRGRWRAKIRIGKKDCHLGTFGSKEDACAAYLRKAEMVDNESMADFNLPFDKLPIA